MGDTGKRNDRGRFGRPCAPRSPIHLTHRLQSPEVEG